LIGQSLKIICPNIQKNDIIRSILNLNFMTKENRLSREEFLKATYLMGGAILFGGFTENLADFSIPALPGEKDPEKEKGLVLNGEIKEILSLTPRLSFDKAGHLLHLDDNQILPVSLVQTGNDKYRRQDEGEKIENVLLMIHHFDGGAPRRPFASKDRTADTTVYGLDHPNWSLENVSTPTVHFCVDNYPVNPEGNKDAGFGILQSQKESGNVMHPTKGQHVFIGINRANGMPDINKKNTLSFMNELEIVSNLGDQKMGDDINSYSLGYEQVGWYFSRSFPEHFPENRQIANVFGLSLAVSAEYKLGPWDNVGHHEVQEKADPGDEFMLLIRYLYGVSVFRGLIDKKLVFEDDSPKDYFGKIKNYFLARAGKHAAERYKKWNEIYGMDRFINSLPDRA